MIQWAQATPGKIFQCSSNQYIQSLEAKCEIAKPISAFQNCLCSLVKRETIFSIMAIDNESEKSGLRTNKLSKWGKPNKRHTQFQRKSKLNYIPYGFSAQPKLWEFFL